MGQHVERRVGERRRRCEPFHDNCVIHHHGVIRLINVGPEVPLCGSPDVTAGCLVREAGQRQKAPDLEGFGNLALQQAQDGGCETAVSFGERLLTERQQAIPY
jgi:hypothetical protein